MNGSTWVGLIKRIPEAQHENLVAVTNTGAEIMVQRILILEEGYIIFRGRPSGSTEVPRILLMPFDQLNHLAFNKPLPEAEIQALFGSGTEAVGAVPAKAEVPSPVPALEEQPASVEAPPPPPPESPANPPAAETAPPKPSQPSKSLLLARLRARLAKN